MAAYTAASAVAAALLLVASVRRVPAGALTAVENIPDPELNDRFLHATGRGVAGEDFVQRLEDVWFIEKHSGREDLAVDATELSAAMQIAGFPEDMQAAVDVRVNPCDDFYEFAGSGTTTTATQSRHTSRRSPSLGTAPKRTSGPPRRLCSRRTTALRASITSRAWTWSTSRRWATSR
jgi:hypothetical protein